mmetsp:Transcript_45380/g.119903  ORF Transcript_45380/g.119903 Transcript_45380/m.119903 type:complete len:941 (+) Transcript_45380:165-2987(+)
MIGLGDAKGHDGFMSDETTGNLTVTSRRSDGRGVPSSDGTLPPGPNETQADACMRGLAMLVYRWRWPLVVFWPLLSVAMLPYVVMLFKNLYPFPSGAPEGTKSAEAEALLETHFDNVIGLRREMVVLRCKTPCESAATVLATGYTEELMALVERFGNDHPGTVIQVHSYFTYEKLDENPMISHDRQSILLQWMWRVPDELKHQAEAFLGTVLEQVEKMNAMESDGPDALSISTTGPTFLERVLRECLNKEIPIHEVSTIWVPFLVVAFSLRSWRMLLLVMISMPMRIVVSLGVLYFVSTETVVLFDAFNLMLMLCTGLTFDYSLFCLSRFAEERAAGASVKRAVLVMTAASGHVVVVTGAVLMIAYGSMLVLPGAFKSFCIGACIMIFMCMAVQLTWVPALLAVCPFFSGGSPADAELVGSDEEELDSEGEVMPDGQHYGQLMYALPPSKSSEKAASHHGPDGAMARVAPHMQGTYYWLGGLLTSFPANVLVPLLIYVLFMPLTLRMKTMRMGHGFDLQIPRHVHEWSLALQIQRDFSPDVGTFYPMLIVGTNAPVTGGDGGRMMEETSNATTPINIASQGFFDANCEMIERLMEETKGTPYALGPENFISTTYHDQGGSPDSGCLNYELTHMFRTNMLTQKLFATSRFLDELWAQLTNTQKDAMLTLLNPSIDPFSQEAFDLVAHLRRYLEGFKPSGSELPGLTFQTLSATSAMMDMIEIADTRGKIALMACAIVCFVMIAISFGAALIPIKMLFTVIVPITWTYGAALYVFEDGALSWLGYEGLAPAGRSGIHWTVFLLTPTFMMGLALDYDIFLFTRVWEFRKEGFGERESIQLGLSATGPLITSAGLIMAFSFCGQILASVAAPNQMGFCIVFSILVDTFVVRTVLVPCVLSLSPRLNYWPQRMPEVEYEWLDRPAPQSSRASGRTHSSLTSRSSR